VQVRLKVHKVLKEPKVLQVIQDFKVLKEP
jgi:hypothetical protein